MFPRVTSENSMKYAYTKTSCNSLNVCQSIFVECEGDRLVKKSITGNYVQMPEDYVINLDEENYCVN